MVVWPSSKAVACVISLTLVLLLEVLTKHSVYASEPHHSIKKLQHELKQHRDEYKRLRRELIQNRKKERRFRSRGQNLSYQILKLKMDKETLHVKIEHSRIDLIKMNRKLRSINQRIKSEKVSLSIDQKQLDEIRFSLLSDQLKILVSRLDQGPVPVRYGVDWMVQSSKQQNLSKRMAQEQMRELRSLDELSAWRKKRTSLRALRKRTIAKESRERSRMQAMRQDLNHLLAMEKHLMKDNHRIRVKTQHLLGLIRHLAALSRKDSTRVRISRPIHLGASTLLWPVRGEIVESFGRFHDGIDISVHNGEPVHCSNRGQVIFAQHYSGYGKMVIVNHGGHIYSLYGHLGRIVVTKGQLLKKGALLGYAGGGGSHGKDTLFFGLTHRGNPVNPVPYLSRK